MNPEKKGWMIDIEAKIAKNSSIEMELNSFDNAWLNWDLDIPILYFNVNLWKDFICIEKYNGIFFVIRNNPKTIPKPKFTIWNIIRNAYIPEVYMLK